jgi:hypothetical protein
LSRRFWLTLAGAASGIFLWWLAVAIPDSDWDTAGANLAVIGLLVGLHYRTLHEPHLSSLAAAPVPRARGFVLDDALLAVVAVVSGGLIATYLLERHTSSGDEWANTYQAAIFWKGKVYAAVPECKDAFRSYWVYPYEGRSFAQYTPGWPLFMTPFVGLGFTWLAGPVAFGLLVVGVMRVARRAAAGFTPGTSAPSRSEVRVAGISAGLAVLLGSTMLINGGSRYPHVFVAAMFAWSVDALLRASDPALDERSQWMAGAMLGTTSLLMVSARPADGLTLGVGLFAYGVYALARKRVRLRAIAGTVLAAAFWGGLTLVIMRIQLGVWFRTGYSITEQYYTWNHIGFSMPKPDELRAGLPLASGSYCWWPCSPTIGLAGIAVLRGRARRIAFIFLASFVPFVTFYVLFEIGRHGDAGFGPRYEFPWVVPMAVGAGVMMALLWRRARAHGVSALHAGGPFGVALVAVIVGLVRIAPFVYPDNRTDVREHNRLQIALAKANLHHTVVLAHDGVSSVDSMDLTEDYPVDLYPNQDVLIARADSVASEKCVREHFKDRTIVHARMHGGEVHLEPDKP